MIYVETSVLLARLLAEDRCPPDSFWDASLFSSRLTQYEVWTRIHARRLQKTHEEAARALLGRLTFVEMTSPVLARALEPFSSPLRTLDALHLASAHFLHQQDPALAVATYDRRLAAGARALGIRVREP